MKFFNYLMVILMALILSYGGAAGAYFFSNLIMIKEVNQAIDTSCWSGFSAIDMNWLATRKDINVNEYRLIELNKVAAENIAVQHLKTNLNLDANWYPKAGPTMDRTKAVVLQSIEVINGSEVPTTVAGHGINETTIHVVMDVPTKFFSQKYYQRFNRYVDLSDFITDSQLH